MKPLLALIADALKWAEALFATRYSLLCGAILLLLPLLGFVVATPLFAGFFILENAMQFATLTWLSAMNGLMILATFRVSQINAPVRLEVATLPGTEFGKSCWIVLMFFTLYLPTCAAGASLAQHDHLRALTGEISLGISLGVAAGMLTGLLLATLQRVLMPPEITSAGLLPFEQTVAHLSTWPRVVPFWDRVAQLIPWLGYTRVERGRRILAPGHAQLTLIWLFVIAVYLLCYLHDRWRLTIPGEGAQVPALGYLLVLVLLVGFTLNGMSFFLDYFRLPTLGLMGLSFAVSYLLFDVDHYYSLGLKQLDAVQEPASARQTLELAQAFDRWKFPMGPDGKRTMVVVTASGGGIQAAAWTARVLTGLDEELQNFSESIGMVSSVSGGSVGAMYYLHHRGDRANGKGTPLQIPAEIAAAINRDARASSLESVAWGFAFPDLLRTLHPHLVPSELDRGWAQEMDWQRRLKQRGSGQGAEFAEWRRQVRRGRMPIAIFNSTLTETGQRFLISPVILSPDDPTDESSPVELLQRIPRANPCITTAARLSATFPFVSPISRPMIPDELADGELGMHAADGGYADNEGIVTAAQWIEHVLDSYRQRGIHPPFDRVLVLRIEPFAKPTETSSPPPWNGIVSAIAGPLLALNAVRGTSQVERGNLEIDLLERASLEREFRRMQGLPERLPRRSVPRGRGLSGERDTAKAEPLPATATPAAWLNQLNQVGESMAEVVEIRSVVVQFETSKKAPMSAPLSWKLTPMEKRRIDDSWKVVADRELRRAQVSQLPASGEPLEPRHLSMLFSKRPAPAPPKR